MMSTGREAPRFGAFQQRENNWIFVSYMDEVGAAGEQRTISVQKTAGEAPQVYQVAQIHVHEYAIDAGVLYGDPTTNTNTLPNVAGTEFGGGMKNWAL